MDKYKEIETNKSWFKFDLLIDIYIFNVNLEFVKMYKMKILKQEWKRQAEKFKDWIYTGRF